MKELLERFCSTDEYRPTMHKPFSRGEYTYATTGHIMVRIPRLPSVPEIEDAPNPTSVFKKLGEASGWYDVPAVPELERCGECKGEAPPSTTCDECRGEGYTECISCFSEVQCSECGGTGKVDGCWSCKGQVTDTRDNVVVGDVLLSAKNIELAGLLPGCKIGPAGVNKNALLRFDGGDGVIAPCWQYTPREEAPA